MKGKKLIFTLVAVIAIAGAGCGQLGKVKQAEEKKQRVLERFPELTKEGEALGTYNGTPLEYGFDFSVFEEDGWKLDTNTTYKQTNGHNLYFVNEKYPGVYLSINSGVASDASEEERILYKAGVMGYTMSVVGAEDREGLPPMEFKGLPWGTSGEEITQAYGEANEIYDEHSYGTNMERYLYIGTDMAYIIEFQVYDETEATPGLATIAFTCTEPWQ